MENGRNCSWGAISPLIHNILLPDLVKTGIRFSLRDKRLFEITEVEITRVDCIYISQSPFYCVTFKCDLDFQAGWTNVSNDTSIPKGEQLCQIILKLMHTLMCLSIGTPKNNKFSICSKWKIHYFQVPQILDIVQPHYNVLEYWDT